MASQPFGYAVMAGLVPAIDRFVYHTASSQLHPVVPPQVSHLRQAPLQTIVKAPHSGQLRRT